MRHIFIDSVSGFLLGTNEIKVNRALELTSRPAGASQVALVVKNLPANAGELRDSGSIPGLGRSPGEGHGNPLQCFAWRIPMDRGAWRATVHRVGKIRT